MMQAMPDLTIQRPCPPNDGRGFESGGVGQKSADGDSSADSGAGIGAVIRDSLGEDSTGHDCNAGESIRATAAVTDEENKGLLLVPRRGEGRNGTSWWWRRHFYSIMSLDGSLVP